MNDVVNLILPIHCGATLFMTGLIWFVQVVHYPLLGEVGRDCFVKYELAHMRLTTWVVAPVMILEAVTAGILVWQAPQGIQGAVMWCSAVLLAMVWLSTAVLQVPCHRRLSIGFDPRVHRRLVDSNWIRVLGWTGRAALVMWLIVLSNDHAG